MTIPANYNETDMPKSRPFQQVDVFTSRPYSGNPLAVVLDGTGLSDDEMQRFALWTNLSETTFLLPPTPEGAAAGADYRVRIFTTHYEMPFAGHPTLGSCHAWLHQGGVPGREGIIVQECKVGLVRIRQAQQRLAFAAPPMTGADPSPGWLEQVRTALGLPDGCIVDARMLNNGPTHAGLLLNRLDEVLSVRPDEVALAAAMRAAGVTGIGIAALHDQGEQPALIARSNREARAFGASTATQPDLEVRFFHLGSSVSEDPVTGSFNASLAQWLINNGHIRNRYLAAQGTCIGRAGRVYIEQDASGQVWVGGESVTCLRGEVSL